MSAMPTLREGREDRAERAGWPDKPAKRPCHHATGSGTVDTPHWETVMARPLRAHTYASVPYRRVQVLLAEEPHHLLQTSTDDAATHGHDLLATLRASVAGIEVSRDILVDVGDLQVLDDERCVLPISWRAARGSHLFPTADATLELWAMTATPPLVQVVLAGSYDPPLGVFGDVVDRTLMQGFTEAVAQRFVADVATYLEERLAPAMAGSAPAAIRMSPATS